MEKYKVLTKESILDINTESTETALAFIEEQNQILSNAGYTDINYIVRFFESSFRDENIDSMTIADAVQCLAIKEGYDLVSFENGRIGYISYYGNEKDGFEIISIDSEE